MCLAIPGKILEITDDGHLTRAGRVSFGGVIKEVILSCVPDAEVGEFVIVHVGVAISKVNESEAKRVFEYLSEMDELAELDSTAD